jgi:hypothetical protein
LYIIANEQNYTIASFWDGNDLKISFRRNVSPMVFDKLLELCNLISFITLSEEEDTPIWMFHPSGVYSVKSLCGIVNNRDIVESGQM